MCTERRTSVAKPFLGRAGLEDLGKTGTPGGLHWINLVLRRMESRASLSDASITTLSCCTTSGELHQSTFTNSVVVITSLTAMNTVSNVVGICHS